MKEKRAGAVGGAGEGGAEGGAGLTVQGFRVAQVLLELLVEVLADADVLEHALQLGRVFKPARLLQGEDNTQPGSENHFETGRDREAVHT